MKIVLYLVRCLTYYVYIRQAIKLERIMKKYSLPNLVNFCEKHDELSKIEPNELHQVMTISSNLIGKSELISQVIEQSESNKYYDFVVSCGMNCFIIFVEAK